MLSQIKQTWHLNWINYFAKQKLTRTQTKFICKNENLIPDLAVNKIDINWEILSSNPNLTINFILAHTDKNWDWKQLSEHPIITPEIVETYPLPWHFEHLAKNPSTYTDLAFVERNLSKLGHCNVLQNAPFSFIRSRLALFEDWPERLASNRTLDPSFVLEHLDKNWSWFSLSYNPAITLSFISENIGLPWIDSLISMRATPEFIEAHDLDWSYINLSSNPNIMPLVRAHPERAWSWTILSKHEKLTIDDVLSLPEKPWNWELMSFTIPMKDILSHPDPRWDWKSMSHNRHLDITFIQNALFQSWSLTYLCCNQMTEARDQYISDHFMIYLKQLKFDMENELIEVANHPDRIEWFLDNEQKEKWGLKI